MVPNPHAKVYCVDCKEDIDPGFQHCPNCGADQSPPVRKPNVPYEGRLKATTQTMWLLCGVVLFLVSLARFQYGNSAWWDIPFAFILDVPSLVLAIFLCNGHNEQAAHQSRVRLIAGTVLWVVGTILWVRYTSSGPDYLQGWKTP